MDLEKESTRHTILTTALDLFALRGYDAVGVQEIVDESGVTKPTLYHHFGNKRGLLDAIIDRYGNQMYAVIDRGAAYNHDIVMNLTVLVRDYVAFALSHQAYFRFHLALLSTPPENISSAAYQSFRTAFSERLERLFREASADHGNMKGRERLYSENFQGMLRAWALLVVNREIELSDETLNRVVHFFMHGIFS